jgi:hypothetical protein
LVELHFLREGNEVRKIFSGWCGSRPRLRYIGGPWNKMAHGGKVGVRGGYGGLVLGERAAGGGREVLLELDATGAPLGCVILGSLANRGFGLLSYLFEMVGERLDDFQV